jgi:hypothetical protein
MIDAAFHKYKTTSVSSLNEKGFKTLLTEYSLIPAMTNQLIAKNIFSAVATNGQLSLSEVKICLYVAFSLNLKDDSVEDKANFIQQWFKKFSTKIN